MNPQFEAGASNCGNCGTPMPAGLRFCRNCGFRLGEGAAEYTETVRFQNVAPGALPGNSAGFGATPAYAPMTVQPGRKRRRISGTTWMFIGLLVFFVFAAGFTSLVKRNRSISPPRIVNIAPRSYAGVDGFETTDGGVTFGNVEPQGGPADLAGLVGGDIITSVDGHPVISEDQITELLRSIPIGKTVDVVYLRDGETKTTKLTTISKQEMDRLNEIFAARPEGRGRFGFDDDETERVPIAGTNLFGVRVDEISPSLPADMAGIKNGDVIIEFDGVPIRTVDELRSRVNRAIPYQTIKVVVMRGAEKLEIPVKMGKL
jgi:membrane-associated protease RseP (regulator of RpoE activity)